jgi:ribosomal subunit interface protein
MTVRFGAAEDIRDMVEEKLSPVGKLLANGGEGALLSVEASTTADGEKHGEPYRAEANLSADGKLYRAVARAETMPAALDKLRDELEQELRHKRGRARRLFRRGAAAAKDMMRGWR